MRRRHLNERGISLIEIMIALSILSTALIALGSLMFQVARQSRNSAAAAYRAAAIEQAAAWVEGLDWDSIPPSVGCDTMVTGGLVYTRCSTSSDISARLRRVTVVISPTGPTTILPETLLIDRNKPRKRIPFR